MLHELFTRSRPTAAWARLCEAPAPRPAPGEFFRSKPSVLVVDDDPDIPPVVELALGRFGFAIESASDVASAVVRLRLRDYDLVILDLGMPESGGFDLLQVMKRETKWREIPVLVLTADLSEEALARSFGYGADDFVSKPFKPNELGIRAYRLVTNPAGPL